MIIVAYVTLSCVNFSSHISLNVLGLRTKYVFLMEPNTLVLLKLMQKVVFVMYLQKKLKHIELLIFSFPNARNFSHFVTVV